MPWDAAEIMAMSAPPPPDDDEDAPRICSLAQRNYNAIRRRELRDGSGSGGASTGGSSGDGMPRRCYKCGKPGHLWISSYTNAKGLWEDSQIVIDNQRSEE